VFRCACLRLLQNASDDTLNSVTEALLNPKQANSFGALYAIYRTAKELVKRWIFVCFTRLFLVRLQYVCRYGDVRVWNAEVQHRPAGHESDPRSAVYVKTGQENASFTFSLLFDDKTSSFIRPFAHFRSCGTWSAPKWRYPYVICRNCITDDVCLESKSCNGRIGYSRFHIRYVARC
jgi:hypothetical protein